MKRHLLCFIATVTVLTTVFTACTAGTGQDKIQMTMERSENVKISISGIGTISIDWGDGTAVETGELSDQLSEFAHSYSEKLSRTVTITGGTVTVLFCFKGSLTSLDVSNCTSLKKLFCVQNQLTSLDVSKNIMLEELDVYSNRLTGLDISKNTALQIVRCSENRLTSLDVSKNKGLTHLWCNQNQLTSLDVSKNTGLTFLDCQLNALSVAALNDLFRTLHGNRISEDQIVHFAENPGTDDCDASIAEAKGWYPNINFN